MTDAPVIKPPCVVCGEAAAHVELVPPGQEPAEWSRMSAKERAAFDRWRDHSPDGWLLLYASVATAGEGGILAARHKPLNCQPVNERRMTSIRAGFAEPYRFELVETAGFYDDAGMCGPCDAFYCTAHWNIAIDYARCPHDHFKSLNPYYRD